MSKRTIFKLPFLIVTMIAVLFAGTGTALAAAPENPIQLDYVALGDSLAEGYGSPGDGYTDYIKDMLKEADVNGRYVNYGVSGYTTTNLLYDLSEANNNNIRTAIKNAEIITLDIGANDLLGPLTECIRTNYALLQSGAITPGEFGFRITNAVNAIDPTSLTNIYTILGTIRALNQDAQIYVMGYYDVASVFAPFFAYGDPTAFSREMDIAVAEVNLLIQDACRLYGAAYIDTSDVIHASDLIPNDIHPTAEGYDLIGEAFWNIIQNDIF